MKQIKSRSGELHFRRWLILKLPWFSIFLHKIYKSDQDNDQHDHPWDFLSIILCGGYVEKHGKKYTAALPFSILRRAAEYHHKIRLIAPTISLVFARPRRRVWGYNTKGGWISHKDYRKKKRVVKPRRSIKDLIKCKKIPST